MINNLINKTRVPLVCFRKNVKIGLENKKNSFTATSSQNLGAQTKPADRPPPETRMRV